MTGWNPFDWYGSAFLALYAFLFVGALLGSFAIAAWLRPEGRALPVIDDDELALLAGGSTRLGETVLARLFARRAITISSEGIHLHTTVAGPSEAERDVLSMRSPFKWKAIGDVLAGSVTQLERRLIERGLLMADDETRQLRIYAALPLLLLIGIGLIKLVVGAERVRPVEFLIVFLVLTAVVAFFRLFRVDRRTRAGVSAVTDARQRHERLSRAPTEAEVGTAVALFGTAVLVGSSMADLHQMRRNSGDGGSGSGDSGGGGCGGGCGGCGG